MPEHVLRVVATLKRDEPLVLFGAIYHTEAVGGFIGHEIHIAAGRERLHRFPGLADPGDVTIGIGISDLPGADEVEVVLGSAVGEGGGVLLYGGDGAALCEERHGRERRGDVLCLADE